MAPDIGTGQELAILLALLFPVPFLIPVLASAVTAWVLRLGPGALVWGVLFGIATVPLSLVFLRYSVVSFSFPSGWYGWSVALVIGVTLTVLFLWWRSRARHSAQRSREKVQLNIHVASELNRDSSDDTST